MVGRDEGPRAAPARTPAEEQSERQLAVLKERLLESCAETERLGHQLESTQARIVGHVFCEVHPAPLSPCQQLHIPAHMDGYLFLIFTFLPPIWPNLLTLCGPSWMPMGQSHIFLPSHNLVQHCRADLMHQLACPPPPPLMFIVSIPGICMQEPFYTRTPRERNAFCAPTSSFAHASPAHKNAQEKRMQAELSVVQASATQERAMRQRLEKQLLQVIQVHLPQIHGRM